MNFSLLGIVDDGSELKTPRPYPPLAEKSGTSSILSAFLFLSKIIDKTEPKLPRFMKNY
jgi:hypothetical protein